MIFEAYAQASKGFCVTSILGRTTTPWPFSVPFRREPGTL